LPSSSLYFQFIKDTIMKSFNKSLVAIALVAGAIALPVAAQSNGQYNSNGNFAVFELSSTVAIKTAQPAAAPFVTAKAGTKNIAAINSPWGGQYNSDGNFGVFSLADTAHTVASAKYEPMLAGHFVDGANSAM
jgi:hypothetical protein